jgi:hypothetical protein
VTAFSTSGGTNIYLYLMMDVTGIHHPGSRIKLAFNNNDEKTVSAPVPFRSNAGVHFRASVQETHPTERSSYHPAFGRGIEYCPFIRKSDKSAMGKGPNERRA